ncbi:TrbG/VirB9 family P-type conjugative transfer protein [Flavobacterium sp. MXW15]|nr:TrbG/VirB9 family P-type conjugative transfer protein [Flavobacterium sp. MXW15]
MKVFKRSCLTILMAFLAWVGHPEVAGAQIVDEYVYEQDKIYTVKTGLGITTQIELSPYEEVLDYSTGFSSGWELTRRDNVFYLKPRNTDVDTNMMIRTATNSYIFELKVVATDWRTLEQAKAAGVQYKIRFAYPGDVQFANAKKETTDAADKPASELDVDIDKNRAYYFNYEFASRDKRSFLIPSNAYDDGKFTYIKLNIAGFPTANFPAVFGRSSRDGDEFVVNTTVEGNTLIVHGTYPYLVLRHGNKVVGIRRSVVK